MHALATRGLYDLTGQKALITGGARGIGRGIALELAQAGAKVVIADLNLEAAQKLAKEIEDIGGKAAALELDVTNDDSIGRCVERAINTSIGLDILVNNAGVHCERIGEISTIQQFIKCIDVNLLGVWRMSQAVVAHFRERNAGRIVNIASIDGRKAWADTPAYSASKAAVINLTQSLATSLKRHQINVNAVCPGGVMTAMANSFVKDSPDLEQAILGARALKRSLDPADIGGAVLFFVSASSKSITGQCLNVDGGVVFN